jgi:FAD/FMN-containing dehydrogenase
MARGAVAISSSVSLVVVVVVVVVANAGVPIVRLNGWNGFEALEVRNSDNSTINKPIVLTAHDALFKNASLDWNQGLCQPVPNIIVFASETQDVVDAVKYATEHSLSITVRSGRHSYECFSVGDGSMVIDVSRMRRISLASQTTIGNSGTNQTHAIDKWVAVNVEPGVQLIELNAWLWQHSQLVFAGGSCPTVASGGFTLGGGYGFLSRLLGLGCDQILRAQVVLANGQVVVATNGSSLLWALQGAGNGNFGIVTNLTVRAALLAAELRHSTVHYSVYWNQSDALAATLVWQQLLIDTDAEHRLSLSFVVYSSSVKMLAQFLGTERELLEMLAPLLAVGTPYDITSTTFTSYLDAVLDFAGCGDLQQCLVQTHQWPASQGALAWKAKSAYVTTPLSRAQTASMLQWMLDAARYRSCCDGQFAGFMLDPYGGAIAQIASNATAFPHRNALYHIQLIAYWNASNLSDRRVTEQWLSQVYADLLAMLPTPHGSYRNYPDLDLRSTYMQMYYANNTNRLQSLKQVLDPNNVFRYPQTIPLPLASGTKRKAPTTLQQS